MKVSVILPIYREPLCVLRNSIESILTQKLITIELELILVVDLVPLGDDVKYYLERLQADHSSLVIIFNDQNIGLPKSLNRGIAACSGDYIARMDADDISFPNRLQRQYQFITSNNYDLVGSSIRNFIYSKDNKAIMKNVRRTKASSVGLYYRTIAFHPTWFGKAVVFKSTKYRDLLYCQDIDFLFACLDKGYSIGNCDDVLLSYNCAEVSANKRLKQFLLGISIRKAWRHENGSMSFINKNYTEDLKKSFSVNQFIKFDPHFVNNGLVIKLLVSLLSPFHLKMLVNIMMGRIK